MIVGKPVPCSLYDIQGMQNWLDEMALQGLFLHHISYHSDRCFFEEGEPSAVRYRLDPTVRRRDEERRELYAQAGWNFVGVLGRYACVFSCEDPSVPELYTDPQSLAYALRRVVRRKAQIAAGLLLFMALFTGLLFYLYRDILPRSILLGDKPFLTLWFLIYCLILPIGSVQLILELRAQRRICRTLEQGLPLRPGRRWNRPRWIVVYLAIILPLNLMPVFSNTYTTEKVWDLGETVLTYQPPTLTQTEALGPYPLEREPFPYGYATTNSSYFAPVQEFTSTNWETRFDSPVAPQVRDYWTGVRYIQARSPKAAEAIFLLKLEDTAKTLDNWAKWDDQPNHVTGSTQFIPCDWPGTDRLEVAQYRQKNQDCWTFAALRGRDILVVQYRGFAQPEECIGLFLEALDG